MNKKESFILATMNRCYKQLNQFDLINIYQRNKGMYEGGQHFKKKREEFSYNIRKNNREEKIQARRNLNTSENKKVILEGSIADQLSKFMECSYHIQNIPLLSQYIRDENIMKKHEGIIGLRKIMCQEQSAQAQQYILKMNLIPDIVAFMDQNQYQQLKMEAGWVLANMLIGSSKICQIIVEHNTIPLFVEMMNHDNLAICEQGVWAVSNLAAERHQYRDLVLNLEGLTIVINKLQYMKNKKQIKTFIWAISNLCRGQPSPSYQKIKIAVPVLANAIMSGLLDDETEVLSDSLWALSYMSDGPKIRLQRVIETNVLSKISQLCLSKYPMVYIPALRIMGNCSASSEEQTQALIDSKFLDSALILLSNDKKIVRRQAAWILSNVAAGSPTQVITLCVRMDIIGKLVNMLQNQAVQQVKIEICWLFANLGREGNPEAIAKLYTDIDLVDRIGDLIKSDNNFYIKSGLDILYKVLILGEKYMRKSESKAEEFNQNQNFKANNIIKEQIFSKGFVTRIQELQHHEDKKVYELVHKVIQRFFANE